jgi:hypothetical protein
MTIAMTKTVKTKRAPLTFDMAKVHQVSGDSQQTDLPASAKPRKPAKQQTKTGRDGRQFVAAHVTPEAAKQFKLLAVQQEKTTQDLLIEAMNDLFAKNGLSRIA